MPQDNTETQAHARTASSSGRSVDSLARMPLKTHAKLLVTGVAVWAAFWVLGLPSYYQQYPFWLLAVATAALVPPSAWFGWKMIRATRPEHRAARGFWLAFYFTVPFMLLDAAYCGVYLGHGTAFFAQYWYLTVFYVIPWLLFVPMGPAQKGGQTLA